MGFSLLLLLVALAAGQTCNAPNGEDRRPDRSVLRVATFNLAWLFDGSSDPSGSPWTSVQAAQTHIRTVAGQILSSRADVVAVHEVEDCAVLSQLVAQLGSAWRFFLVPGTDSATGQNSAVVTRLDPVGPVVRTEARASLPVPGSRCGAVASGSSGVSKHGKATFQGTGLAFDLVFGHFKSGGAASDCAQREAQAAVLRSLVTAGRATIVAGDFNDWDDTFDDAQSNRGTSLTLATLKAGSMLNAASRLPQAQRDSSGVGLIDHVLLSDGDLVSRLVSVSINGSGVPTTSSARIAAFYSDHLPVVVTLRDSAAGRSGPLLALLVGLALAVMLSQ